jgi:hypothetical protein
MAALAVGDLDAVVTAAAHAAGFDARLHDVFVQGEGDENPRRAPLETPMTDALAACEADIFAQLTALTGDLAAFADAERCQRWHSQGDEPPLMASVGEGRLVCGFGLDVARLDPCCNATVVSGTVPRVGVRLSPFYAHAWAADDVFPLQDADPEAAPEALKDLAACQDARAWVDHVLHCIVVYAITPRE